MSVFQAAMPTGSYPSLMAGGVQCAQLYNNADLNDCVPENDKVFQAWVCTGNGTSDTMSNTPYANFGRTFYLTAVKTWYNRQNADKFSVTQTLYSVEPHGNSLIWTRSIDGAGTLGWSDWKEIVVADGTYPSLTAGKAQLSNNNLFYNGDFSLNTLGQSQYVDNNNQYNDCVDNWGFGYGASILEVLDRGVKITPTQTTTAVNFQQKMSKDMISHAGNYVISFEVDNTDNVNQIFAGYVNSSGQTVYFSNFSVDGGGSISGNYYRRGIIVSEADLEEIHKESSRLNNFGIQVKAGTESLTIYSAKLEEGNSSTLPYGVTNNATKALYAESIPVASETVFGGAKMWVKGGKLYIKTE